MDVVAAINAYITRMVEQTSGVKVLLLDADTTPIMSMASTTSALLSQEVYLTDRLDNTARERMPHLKCICFLRPTQSSLAAMEEELRHPRYSGYWIFFTNILQKSAIERLAEADQSEVVREVQEYFADFSPITSSHYTLNCLPAPLSPYYESSRFRLYGDTPGSFDASPTTGSLQRHKDGLTAVLLSLKKKPIIRFERMSPMAKKLGQEIQQLISAESTLFDFRPSATQPVLLILDRRNDPVTPLLTQWTYQAMVHDLMGITNGRVDLSKAPDIREDVREVVISPEQDSFFARNLYDNFGDLGANVKAYVNEYQNKSFSTGSGGSASGTSTPGKNRIETIADMKRFVEEYPEFRKLGGNVSKHVALIGELSRLVSANRLLEVSELEQSLACAENHRDDLRSLQNLIKATDIAPANKLRLALLYALRYQKYSGNAINLVVDSLLQNGVSESDAALVHVMLNFAGAEQRQDDLFMNEGFLSRGKSVMKGLKGIENVYTQHTPHISQTIELLLRGRLRDASYPFLENAPPPNQLHPRPQDVILFIIGGTTYEEARTVAMLNQQFASGQNVFGLAGPGAAATSTGLNHTRIIIGGTGVLNSSLFLDMLRDAATRFPPSMQSSSLSLRPPPPEQQSSQESFNLQLGNISLSVAPPNIDLKNLASNPTLHRAGNTLEAGVDGAANLARNVFGKLMDRVQQA
ncbi:vacuolar protein sorting-associated protein 45 [Cystobasidiomycetes sp. EMM_F5]